MKKMFRRAGSVLVISFLVIVGLVVYILNYVDNGGDWALYFSRANSGSTGQVLDRYGEVLASCSATESLYSPDELTRRSCYHIVGDYTGRTTSGVLSSFWSDLQGFSLITGTTQAADVKLDLTVDAALNRTAYEALAGRKGAVLVSNYKTGEILCHVSTPSVDPLNADQVPEDGAFINRCFSAAFTPGSTMKLVTAAAAIENIPDIFSRTFYCEGEYEVAGVTITCSGTHYTQTFEQALANSCNVAFAQIAIMLGQDTMKQYVGDYGFIDGHEVDGITTIAGNYPMSFVGDPELGWSGVGQSTDLVCPFSMLRYVSAIANGGELVTPHIIADAEQSSVQLMKAETAYTLAQMMSYNVSAHYDGSTNFPGLSIAAKTGTAETGNGASHSWFTGFLNDSEHPYAFVVFIENGGGGLSAAGQAANVILQSAVRR